MSRLDSFIRRLKAQRACIDAAVQAISSKPGLVLEVGLGNGRTYHHLLENLSGRRIVVFERDPQPHPDCWPPSENLMVGDLGETLPAAARNWPGGAALIHSDIGTGDAERNRRVAAMLSKLFPPLLMPNGIVVSDQELTADTLELLPLPSGVGSGRYFIYRRR